MVIICEYVNRNRGSERTGVRSDINFDGKAASFEEWIYGSSRGFIRLSVLWEDLLAEIPMLSHGGLSVLDAGGGAGHVALRMAELGNRVLLCDPSQEMLSRAEESIRQTNLSELVTIEHSTIQELEWAGDGFEVITCHAVLEWLADPEATLGHLVRFLREDGRLSLMFYNRNAAVLKQILRGECAGVLRGSKEDGQDRECTTLSEETVRAWLDALGVKVISKSGIRMFHDHLPDAARSRERLDDLLKVENKLRKQEPFASLGQHVHLVCEWAR